VVGVSGSGAHDACHQRDVTSKIVFKPIQNAGTKAPKQAPQLACVQAGQVPDQGRDQELSINLTRPIKECGQHVFKK
jgi:hypothetical protein